MRKYASFISSLRNRSLCAVIVLLSSVLAAAQHEILLHQFHFADGALPEGALVADAQQNLYGVTYGGGGQGSCSYNRHFAGCGTVFELTRASGGIWNQNVIYAFQGGSDGAFPQAGLVFDRAGNLFGTTSAGGFNGTCLNEPGCGTVFELTPPAQQGGNWTESVLWVFGNGVDGADPRANLIIDQTGNLYGTAHIGGTFGGGTVFELSPPSAPGGSWTETTLHSFTGLLGTDDGYNPVAGLAYDKAGNIYGTTPLGGQYSALCPAPAGCGIVFRLRPSSGGTWTEKVLYAFQGGSDGISPGGNLLVFQQSLVGTTEGGGQNDQGTVFQVAASAGGVAETILYNFQGGSDGISPVGGLVADRAFNVYGTTIAGGSGSGGNCSNNPGCGTVFQLVPPVSPDGVWTESVLYAFQGGKDGALPSSSLLLGNGWLLGTTGEGGGSPNCATNGINGCGTVFAVRK
jgi:uncharacterized repeat protein (TIGR03803 family)